jgi:hypothetical protein
MGFRNLSTGRGLPDLQNINILKGCEDLRRFTPHSLSHAHSGHPGAPDLQNIDTLIGLSDLGRFTPHPPSHSHSFPGVGTAPVPRSRDRRSAWAQRAAGESSFGH